MRQIILAFLLLLVTGCNRNPLEGFDDNSQSSRQRSHSPVPQQGLSDYCTDSSHAKSQDVQSPRDHRVTGGIGVGLSVRDGKVTIKRIYPDTAADHNSAINIGDQIIDVAERDGDSVSLAGKDSGQVAGLIRGPENSIVRLTILPAGMEESNARVVSLTRGGFTVFNPWGDGQLFPPGTESPDFNFVRLSDGTKENLSQYAGKIVILDFWSSGCYPCIKRTDRLHAMLIENDRWEGHVELLAVSVDEEQEPAKKLFQSKQ